jgi:tetratricopeptide (TPR) repeat protein
MASRARLWLPLLALLTATFASYVPVFDAGYILLDDTGYTQTNPHVNQGLTWENVRWAVTGTYLSNWHPLTWWSHMLDVEFFGLDPAGPHIVNVALHGVNVALLFSVLRSLTGAAAPSLFVAGVFALHPVNVESVAWIAQRKTLLSTGFALASIALYARWVRRGGALAYGSSLGCLALSLAAKAMFVTLPLALLLLDWWPLRRRELEPPNGERPTLTGLARGVVRLVPEKIPYALVCVGVSLLTLDAQRDAMSSTEHLPVAQRLGNVATAYLEYLRDFAWPSGLAVFYPLDAEALSAARIGTATALLVGLTLFCVWQGLHHRPWLVGWLWFVGTLVPVIGLVQVGMQSRADRYAYVPYWGLAIVVAWSMAAAGRRWLPAAVRGPLLGGAAVIVLAALGLATLRQSTKWREPIGLFEDALRVTEGNWMAHGFLAARYYALRDFDRTIQHSRAAAESRREMGTVRSTWGLALYELGAKEEALQQFLLATQEEPDEPVGFMNLGWLYTERGRLDLALDALARAHAAIDPTTPPYTVKTIYANWGVALAEAGRLEEAREKFASALAIDREGVDLLRDAARIDLRLGDANAARAKLVQARATDGADTEAALLLAATAVLDEGDTAALHAAIRAAPDRADVPASLARQLAASGRADAGARLLDALAALPDSADAARIRSLARAQHAEIALASGDVRAARALLEAALVESPANTEAANRLAFLLATASDPGDREPARAIALAEQAVARERAFGTLATLAAAYAAADRLEEALAATREALADAMKSNDPKAVAALRHQQSLYSGAAARAAPEGRAAP